MCYDLQLRRQSATTLYVEWIVVNDNRQVSHEYNYTSIANKLFLVISMQQMDLACQVLL